MTAKRRTASESRARSFLRNNAAPGQVIVSILVALLLGCATIVGSVAGSEWQNATREEIKWSAAALETLRFVYTDEAPDAFSIAADLNRANVLESFAAEGDLGLIGVEAATARETAQVLGLKLEGSNELIDERYELSSGGYDIARRLGNLREPEAERSTDSAAGYMSRGDRLNLLAQAMALACVPIVLVWVVGQAAANTVGRARRERAGQSKIGDIDIVPQPWLSKPQNRKLAYGSLAAWILLTLMPVAALGMSAAGQRADAESTRIAVSVTTDISASSLQYTHVLQQVKVEAHLALAGLARQLAALDPLDPSQDQLGRAEEAAATRWPEAAAPMTRMPTREDGVDPGLIRAMATTPADWKLAASLQIAAAESAERAGSAANLATLSVALAAFAMSAITLALATPALPRLVRLGGLFMLAAALATGVASFLVLR